MFVDGRGSVHSILPTPDHQKTSRKYNRTPARPATGTSHAPSLRPCPPCLIITPTHQPPDREIRGVVLGPGSADAPDGEPVAYVSHGDSRKRTGGNADARECVRPGRMLSWWQRELHVG